MNFSKSFAFLPVTVLFLSGAAQAGSLQITCGEQHFEAFDERNSAMPPKAELVIDLKTKGETSTPEVKKFVDDYSNDQLPQVKAVSGYAVTAAGVTSFSVKMKNQDTYAFTGIKLCSADRDYGQGKVAYTRYKAPSGGFPGFAPEPEVKPIVAECSCFRN